MTYRTAGDPAPVPPQIQLLREIKVILERARSAQGTESKREIEAAIERINRELG